METISGTADLKDCSELTSATVNLQQIDDVNVSGNWALYRRRCTFSQTAPVLSPEQAIQAKRIHALAYLGSRAQLHGGVFQPSRPTVFTESVIAALSKRNTSVRFSRYPLLAQIMSLMSALDQAQYTALPPEGNILPFPDGYTSRAPHS